ncbi:hypothetical protein Tco_0739507 [Tanacetum coccineum]
MGYGGEASSPLRRGFTTWLATIPCFFATCKIMASPVQQRKEMEQKKIQLAKAILDSALQFENACTAKNDLRKTYEKCNDIPQESRALIDTFLKEGSDKDYELNLSMYGKTAK